MARPAWQSRRRNPQIVRACREIPIESIKWTRNPRGPPGCNSANPRRRQSSDGLLKVGIISCQFWPYFALISSVETYCFSGNTSKQTTVEHWFQLDSWQLHFKNWKINELNFRSSIEHVGHPSMESRKARKLNRNVVHMKSVTNWTTSQRASELNKFKKVPQLRSTQSIGQSKWVCNGDRLSNESQIRGTIRTSAWWTWSWTADRRAIEAKKATRKIKTRAGSPASHQTVRKKCQVAIKYLRRRFHNRAFSAVAWANTWQVPSLTTTKIHRLPEWAISTIHSWRFKNRIRRTNRQEMKPTCRLANLWERSVSFPPQTRKRRSMQVTLST